MLAAIECPTHSIIDAALRSLPVVLPVLDFSTIKNELFPVIAAVFTRTNSLSIKVRGLQAFVILCGGSTSAAADDGLNGLVDSNKKTPSSSALDKYTMQEKIVPLVKGIKTKEPAVMLAALNVLKIVGQVADSDFVAMEILPILWSMSLGPLLELRQFQTFMELIRTLSRRVEDEQTRKLQELTATNGTAPAIGGDFMSFGGVTGTAFESTGASEDDFESLVKGKATGSSSNNGFAGWEDTPAPASSSRPSRSNASTPQTASFSWSTPPPTSPNTQIATAKAQSSFKATPDLGRFEALAPSSTQFSQAIQPTKQSRPVQSTQTSTSSFNWSSTGSATASSPWASSTPSYTPTTSNLSNTSSGLGAMNTSMSNMLLNQQRPSVDSRGSSFSLPPPPGSASGFSLPSPQQQTSWGASSGGILGQKSPMNINSMGFQPPPQQRPAMGMSTTGMNGIVGGIQPPSQQQQQKSGLDKYESLI